MTWPLPTPPVWTLPLSWGHCLPDGCDMFSFLNLLCLFLPCGLCTSCVLNLECFPTFMQSCLYYSHLCLNSLLLRGFPWWSNPQWPVTINVTGFRFSVYHLVLFAIVLTRLFVYCILIVFLHVIVNSVRIGTSFVMICLLSCGSSGSWTVSVWT